MNISNAHFTRRKAHVEMPVVVTMNKAAWSISVNLCALAMSSPFNIESSDNLSSSSLSFWQIAIVVCVRQEQTEDMFKLKRPMAQFRNLTNLQRFTMQTWFFQISLHSFNPFCRILSSPWLHRHIWAEHFFFPFDLTIAHKWMCIVCTLLQWICPMWNWNESNFFIPLCC